MMHGTAIEALHGPVARVSAHERPQPHVSGTADDLVFAVFEEEQTEVADHASFMGLVRWFDVVRHPGRIFADQLPAHRAASLLPTLPLEACMVALQRARTTALAVLDDGGFHGVVTRQSVLERLSASTESSSSACRWERLVFETQRLEALAMELAGQLHDVRNQLQVASSAASFGSASTTPTLEQALDRALRVSRGSAIAGGAAVELRCEIIGLKPLLTELRGTLNAAVGERGRVEIIGELSLQAFADPLDVERLLVNLVKNAGEAAPGPVCVTIEVTARAVEVAEPAEAWMMPGPYVCLLVRDDGPGMDPARLRTVTMHRRVGARRGLGLLTARRLARRNGGTLRMESTPGEGTRVEVLLPCGPAGSR